MSGVAIVSTGDAEEDRRIIEQFNRSEQRMSLGMCPNGCSSLLVTEEPRVHSCPTCKFVLFGSLGSGEGSSQ